MSALAASCITAGFPVTGAADQWRKYLSSCSLTDIRYGCGPLGPLDCHVRRLYGGLARALERTDIGFSATTVSTSASGA